MNKQRYDNLVKSKLFFFEIRQTAYFCIFKCYLTKKHYINNLLTLHTESFKYLYSVKRESLAYKEIYS
ncbi:MAG: hypothetical protein RLZZ628_3294 [Bacteroidota bacterium]|jgi:hypothetical protein